MTGRRIVSISLPQFAMERWMRHKARQGCEAPDDIPVVLAREGHHGPVIHGANRAAQLMGIHEGARVVDMRALCPDLHVEYADIAGDRAALDRLMLWTRRWCPWSAVDGARGLILDTTGAAHLCGGQAAMLREMEAAFSTLGLSTQLAIAPTWGAAWGLARFGPVRAICPEDGLAKALAPLPVASLRLENKTLLLLRRLGLKTIQALAEIPRLSLTRRFVRAPLEQNPLMRLDQAMGTLAEPVSPPQDPLTFRARALLPEPIADPTAHLPQLCADLCTQLRGQSKGCRHLRLSVFRTDGLVRSIETRTARPSHDPDHLAFLFRDRLEAIDPGLGFDLILLEAIRVEDMSPVQNTLEGGAEDGVDLSRLMDRLTARLGAKAVSKPALSESHVPERAQVWAGDAAPSDQVTAMDRDRPLRLLAHPEEIRVLYAIPEGPPAQFIWRRQTHRVARSAGPERIAPEWWRDKPGTRLRDYFRIEDHAGRRLWLYREGLHGDGRGGDPRWFVHGMFA